jgi:hypothetical protein
MRTTWSGWPTSRWSRITPLRRHARSGAVEDEGVIDLELAEGQLIAIVRLHVVGRKRRGKTVEPAPEEGVHGIGTPAPTRTLCPLQCHYARGSPVRKALMWLVDIILRMVENTRYAHLERCTSRRHTGRAFVTKGPQPSNPEQTGFDEPRVESSSRVVREGVRSH